MTTCYLAPDEAIYSVVAIGWVMIFLVTALALAFIGAISMIERDPGPGPR